MAQPLPYCNNLRFGDKVLVPYRDRAGQVNRAPREDAVLVSILFEGCKAEQYVHISELRLMVDGKVLEDVPPCDGVPPAPAARGAARCGAPGNPREPAGCHLTPPGGISGPDIQTLRRATASLANACRLFLDTVGG